MATCALSHSEQNQPGDVKDCDSIEGKQKEEKVTYLFLKSEWIGQNYFYTFHGMEHEPWCFSEEKYIWFSQTSPLWFIIGAP